MTRSPMRWVELTRTQASEMLGQTHHRRPIGPTTVDRYADALTKGEWRGQYSSPIILDAAGGVLDGNHRLTAFLQSDLEIFGTWLIQGDDPDALLVIDTGKPRSLRDQLQLRGHSHSKELQALFYTARRWAGSSAVHSQTSRQSWVRWIEANPHAAKAAAVAATSTKPSGSGSVVRFPIGTIACLYDIACYAEGGDSVEEFATGAAHGSITFPILSRLQQKLADHSNPRNTFRMSPEQVSYSVTRVYLAWLNEETDLTKLFATRKTLHDLPGWYDWMKAMWPERIEQ